jgi:hypothetical protein
MIEAKERHRCLRMEACRRNREMKLWATLEEKLLKRVGMVLRVSSYVRPIWTISLGLQEAGQ